MGAILLSIVEPENNSAYVGTTTVNFSGSVEIPDELTGIQLYYRWYSSLFEADAALERYSMNEVANSEPDTVYPHSLTLGTHVIAFAVSDVAGETQAEFTAIQHGSVTGGSDEGEEQRLLHVFHADLLSPLDGAINIDHSNVLLQARAPGQWSKPENEEVGGPPYIVNEDYHAVNRLSYRWLFEPVGAPTDRPTIEITPGEDEYTFLPFDDSDPLTEPTRIELSASLPATAVGLYDLTLFVEDKLDELSESDSQQVRITLI